MTQLTVKDIINQFESFAPTSFAMEGDPVGLHFGSKDQQIHKIMVSLDIRPQVVQEAIEKGVNFILVHHPPIFRPIKRFDLSNPQTAMYADIIKHNIAVYAAHTNLDIAPGGINDWLAQALDLHDIEVLSPTQEFMLRKLVVYVPKTASDTVRLALTKAGAGQLSDTYADCSFTSSGFGRFKPLEGAKPAIGQVGYEEVVEEDRIEMIFYSNQLSHVIAALLESHPYEEPAYDILSLENSGTSIGLGRVGNLSQPYSLKELLELVAKKWEVDALRYILPTKNKEDVYQRVALCGGAGSEFYTDALKTQADVYITGDITYHHAHDMQESQLTVIDPGHHTEKICIPRLTTLLNQWKEVYQWQVDIIPSTTNTEPFHFYTK